MLKFFQKAREPVSSYTHFIGAILSAVGIVLLLWKSMFFSCPMPIRVISNLMFGFSLIALYSSSAIYHYKDFSNTLRKLDHAMIYVLIAGTYTPILLLSPSSNNVVFTAVIWMVAFIGIIIKLCWISAPRYLSTILYIAMGWAIVFDISVVTSLQTGAVIYLILGGVSYTIGAVIYAIKKPNISKNFGFHELFHIFCLFGSLFHYLLVYFYIA